MNKNNIWKRLIVYTGHYRKIAIGAVICALLSVIASLIGPLLIGKAIDFMIGPGKVDFDAVLRLLLILAAVYIVGSFFGWLLTYLTNRIAYRTVYDLRRELFDKLNVLPLKFHDNHPQETVSAGLLTIWMPFLMDCCKVSPHCLQGSSPLLGQLC